jgi:ABC-2 type transport system permease protein
MTNVGGNGGSRGGGGLGRLGRLATVIRAGLRSNFGLATLKHRLFKEKKDRWLVPLIGLAALGVLPTLYGIVLLIENAYLLLKPMGQERALLTLGLLAGQLLILLFGIYYIISAFYFSRDLEMLIPLPLRPSEVMISKFAVIMINEYLTVAAIVLPVVITFGIMARGGVGFWVSAVLVYLALPIIPLAVVSVLVVAMMRFINVSRKKDILILIGSIVLITATLGLQFAAGRAPDREVNGQAIADLIVSPNSLLNQIGAKFPPSIWATKAVAGGFSGEGLANLAFFLGISLAFFAGIVVMSEKLFYRGLVGLGETTGKKRRLTRDEMSRRVSSGRRAVAAIFAREWRIMNRTPIFLLNGVLVVILVPVLFIVTARPGSSPWGAAIPKIIAAADPMPLILAAALFMTICGSLNGTSSSTFSREGAQFWISRVIPVAPREQAAAKFLHSYLIAMLGVVTASVVAAIVLHLKAVHLAAAAGLALAAGVLLTAVGMIIDLARPLLDWTNPQKAIKQNLNVLLAMLADIGILTAVFFGVRALIRAKLAANAVLGVLFVGLAALAALSYRILLKFADKRYPEIDS